MKKFISILTALVLAACLTVSVLAADGFEGETGSAIYTATAVYVAEEDGEDEEVVDGEVDEEADEGEEDEDSEGAEASEEDTEMTFTDYLLAGGIIALVILMYVFMKRPR